MSVNIILQNHPRKVHKVIDWIVNSLMTGFEITKIDCAEIIPLTKDNSSARLNLIVTTDKHFDFEKISNFDLNKNYRLIFLTSKPILEIMNYLPELSHNSSELHCIDISNPIWANHLAITILKILKHDYFGIEKYLNKKANIVDKVFVGSKTNTSMILDWIYKTRTRLINYSF